jgi:hypothetical protein
VQQAVLENDIRSAQWQARTLSTATDLDLAGAALSAQLVELEALYQRSPDDARVLTLLDRGYRLWASGFVELRRLEALREGDTARAAQQMQLRADAEARARYYRERLPKDAPDARSTLESALAEPEAACGRHDRAGYEQQLHALLAEPARDAEARLERALLQRLAAAWLSPWLSPGVEARCAFKG